MKKLCLCLDVLMEICHQRSNKCKFFSYQILLKVLEEVSSPVNWFLHETLIISFGFICLTLNSSLCVSEYVLVTHMCWYNRDVFELELSFFSYLYIDWKFEINACRNDVVQIILLKKETKKDWRLKLV